MMKLGDKHNVEMGWDWLTLRSSKVLPIIVRDVYLCISKKWGCSLDMEDSEYWNWDWMAWRSLLHFVFAGITMIYFWLGLRSSKWTLRRSIVP